MKIVLAQIDSHLSRRNLQKHLHIIDEIQDADLIVFPELSLSGYLLQDKLFEDAYTLEELEPLLLKSYRFDIVFGAAIIQEDAIYNSAIYVSKGKIIHLHHKLYLPNYGMFEEARFFSKGHTLEKFQTRFGDTVMLVCEDLWRAQSIQQLASLMPDLIIIIASSPARDFNEQGLLIEDQWNSLLKTAALLSKSSVVFVNRVGFEDGLGFWGGSKLIAPNGIIEKKLPYFEELKESVQLNTKRDRISKMIFKHD